MRTLRSDDAKKYDSACSKISELESSVNNLKTALETSNANIKALEDKTDGYKTSISTQLINAELNGNVTGDSAKINNIQADSLLVNGVEATTLKTGTLNATSANLTTINNSAIISSTVTSNTAIINDLNANNANITNWSVTDLATENITATDTTTDDLNSSYINNSEKITTNTLAVNKIDNGEINSVSSNNTFLIATNAVLDTVENGDISTNSISFSKNYVVVETPTSDTNFNIIKIPKVRTGYYKIEYRSLDNATLYFSLIVNNTAENIYFSYYRGELQKYLDQIIITNDELYAKTWYGGNLYWQSSTTDNNQAPYSYGDWPIDLDKIDYPVFETKRRQATVYTSYVNLNMDSSSIGSALLSYTNTNVYGDAVTDYNEYQYDPNNGVDITTYTPNQDVNKEADVDFNKVTTPTADIETLYLGSPVENQYLTVNTTGGALEYKSPADYTVATEANKDDNSLITERRLYYFPGSENIVKTGEITEGSWNAGTVTTDEANIKTANIETLNTTTIENSGNVHITGDLTVDGTTTTVHSEEITTESDTITLRKNATTGILPGKVSGIEIENCNGDGKTVQLAVDSSGTLRIGTDIGTSGGNNEALLTRDEEANITDSDILIWDAAKKFAKDSGYKISDLLENFKIINDITDVGLETPTTTLETINALSTNYIAILKDSDVTDSPITNAVLILVKKADTYIGVALKTDYTYIFRDANWTNQKTNFEDITATGLTIGTNIIKDNTLSGDINMTGNVVVNNTLVIPTTAPTNPTAGMIWLEI